MASKTGAWEAALLAQLKLITGVAGASLYSGKAVTRRPWIFLCLAPETGERHYDCYPRVDIEEFAHVMVVGKDTETVRAVRELVELLPYNATAWAALTACGVIEWTVDDGSIPYSASAGAEVAAEVVFKMLVGYTPA